MIVNETVDNKGRVVEQKITGPYYNSIWSYIYDDNNQSVTQKRSDSPFYKIITDLISKTSKIVWNDGKEEQII
jgi:hypothetical protein